MKIKKINPVSMGKVFSVLQILLALIIGLPFFAIYLSISFFTHGVNSEEFIFGIAMIIITPFAYGLLGLIVGLVSGWLYNLTSKWVGGVEIEVE